MLVPVNRHVRRRATLNVGGYPSEIRNCSLRSGASSAPDRR
ncbi:hypothetical protein CGRA01v4_10067 [Colletotrichum graminicola]|nr:hypothetical protein CGRA01v4_10067 [Colletotrichum graminicola]